MYLLITPHTHTHTHTRTHTPPTPPTPTPWAYFHIKTPLEGGNLLCNTSFLGEFMNDVY